MCGIEWKKKKIINDDFSLWFRWANEFAVGALNFGRSQEFYWRDDALSGDQIKSLTNALIISTKNSIS